MEEAQETENNEMEAKKGATFGESTSEDDDSKQKIERDEKQERERVNLSKVLEAETKVSKNEYKGTKTMKNANDEKCKRRNQRKGKRE